MVESAGVRRRTILIRPENVDKPFSLQIAGRVQAVSVNQIASVCGDYNITAGTRDAWATDVRKR